MRRFRPPRAILVERFLMNDSENSRAVSFLRLPQVLARFPVCRSTWWSGVKEGIYPSGVKLSKNTTAWLSTDIDQLIERTSKAAGARDD
jgi:prophage regulatory protein